MIARTMIHTDPHLPTFGSDHDTVLAGVTQALHDLFPPIHITERVDRYVRLLDDEARDDRVNAAQD